MSRFVRSSSFRPLMLFLLIAHWIVLLAATAYNGMTEAHADNMPTLVYGPVGYLLDGTAIAYNCAGT